MEIILPEPPEEATVHPLHIPSVVDKIMSNIYNLIDLLAARLVCQQWNEEASKYLRQRIKLKIYNSKEIKQVVSVMHKSKMFKFPLKFDKVHLEARLSSVANSRSFHLFFTEFAPELKSLVLKQSWDSLFPLDRLPQLEELSIYGNLNKQMGIFPDDDWPYLPNLKKADFYLEGRITDPSTLEIFASNISALISAAPNLEEIVAPQKMDHRDETVESYRDDTANHIFLHILAADRDLKLNHLKVLQIDAKLNDYDLSLLGRSSTKLPQLETLRIALSGVATRDPLIDVLRRYSSCLKNLTIIYSKTHGIRMSLTGFFHEESPLQQLESLSLKNYPVSVSFIGAIKQLQRFRVEVRNIEASFPDDRDDFFLQPIPLISMSASSSTVSCASSSSSTCSVASTSSSASSSSSSSSVKRSDSIENSSSYKAPPLYKFDPSKAHGLTSFEYIHNKEGNKINLYGDRSPYNVTRRIAMRFPQLTKLTLDNMTEESMTCVMKYLPLLEELHALGGFYSDLSIVGALSKEEIQSDSFPKHRRKPYIGDLKNLHTLSLGTFAVNAMWNTTELLSAACIYYGILDCKNLRRLALGSEVQNKGNAKFETNIGDQPIIHIMEDLNLTYLKIVKSPLTSSGFNQILKMCRERGVEYSINGYEGPTRPEEFFKKQRTLKPLVQLKRLKISAEANLRFRHGKRRQLATASDDEDSDTSLSSSSPSSSRKLVRRNVYYKSFFSDVRPPSTTTMSTRSCPGPSCTPSSSTTSSSTSSRKTKNSRSHDGRRESPPQRHSARIMKTKCSTTKTTSQPSSRLSTRQWCR